MLSVTVAVANEVEDPSAVMLAGLSGDSDTFAAGPGLSPTLAGDEVMGLGNAELSVAVICIDPAAVEVWTVAV